MLLQKGRHLIIRPEAGRDYGAIREINIAAFAHHPYSHQTEHLIVEALRADGALSVSLVAETEGKVVGHIAFSPVTINGEDRHWFTLGPVAVLPEMQRKGIGTELVHRGLDATRALGAQGCVLVGDPAFYNRFGFVQSTDLAIDGVPAEVMLSLSMAGHMPRGKVEIHPAFFVQA